MIKWNSTKQENETVRLIAQRANALAGDYSVSETSMDVLAAHLNGCRLRLRGLLEAGSGDFMHDVSGIRAHLDRKTGKLGDCFSPRFHA